MRNERWNKGRRRRSGSVSFGNVIKCFCTGAQLQGDQVIRYSGSLPTRYSSASDHSSPTGEPEQRPDTGDIEEAESSLRESGYLNYEEARALLGRYEYQKGNIQAALHVFEGIDIAAVTPKVKITLAKIVQPRKRRSQDFATPPMSIHAASLLLEAFFLKAKSLQALGRYKEAAQSCRVILDIVESSLPAGLPENFRGDCKLQETLNRAVELLPELWKLADSPRDTILSYRRALLNHWNLDEQATAKIQKDFSIFLLYSGCEVIPPNLGCQLKSSFVPKNNVEEAILLLIIFLRKVSLKRIEWDPSVLDHLSYALSLSGGLKALANQVEELLPGTLDQKEMYHILALCYHGEGDDLVALNLWQKLLKCNGDPACISDLMFASKISGEHPENGEGTSFAHRAIESLDGHCDQLMGVAHCMLGISLSANSTLSVADSERVERQAEALQSLETAGRITSMKDPNIIYHLCLENAEQRKLDAALYYAKCLLKLEAGSNIRGWILLARVLSAQKCYTDAEDIINAALDQTGNWDKGELLPTKAKLQIAQGQVKKAIETYTQLLAVLQVQRKTFGSEKMPKDVVKFNRSLEQETWNDLASIYIGLSLWSDAESCLSKSEAVSVLSASRWHVAGLLHEAQGCDQEALKAFGTSLEIDPNYVPSLVSKAVVLRRICSETPEIARSFLMEALKLDRMNHTAWYNLGLLYKDMSVTEAAECFEAAAFLEETAPVEPFR